jgi:15-cis-phytoene synthase
MTVSIEASFAYCRRVTRRRARNFYYAFVLLRHAEHDALCALYAFMRYCDDLSDDCSDPVQARAAMALWRDDLDAALDGRLPGHPVWPAFVATVGRYRIPHAYFRDMIAGVASDLDPVDFPSFDDLYRYCYRVASVPGLSVVHVLGFDDPRALALAEKCGVAFQLTNILRDVKEDTARGRDYFPAEDRARFSNVELLRFEAARAREYYSVSPELLRLVPRRNRAGLWALIEIYRRLLDKIEASGFDVYRRRICLSAWEKSLIVLRAALRRS